MMTTNNRDASIPWTLHDYISLGEVEQGLSMTSTHNDSQAQEEIQRLPLFLRLLSTTRHLVSISIFDTSVGEETDPLVHRTVERLERVAAIHSVAEGVDVVTCYLVPTMTRKLSRVSPLTRALDTSELTEVARNPKGNPSRKKQRLEGNTPTSDAEEDGFSEDEDDDNANDATEEDGDGEKRKKRKRSAPSNGARRRTSLEIAAEDSQEATVVKTLSELTSLVATSLQPFDIHPEENPQDDNHHKETEHSNLPHYSYGKGQFALTIDDSILAETGREDTGGAMELSDLGSTIAAIMHHAPVLQSRHVANALCRASVPQMANLMTRIGANCPASVASLLLGCIHAYQSATVHQNNSIAAIAKQGVVALAQLSPKERSRVIHKLQRQGIMWDVQLELALQDPVLDTTAAPRLLVHQIRLGTTQTPVKSDRQQSAGDEVSDDYPTRQSLDQYVVGNQEPSLSTLLFKRPLLYRNSLAFLEKQIRDVAAQNRLHRAHLVLLLKAYNCLLLLSCPPATPKFERSKFLFDTMLPSLELLTNKVHKMLLELKYDNNAPPTCAMDSLIENLYCAAVLSTARILESSQPDERIIQACQQWYHSVGSIPCPSQRVQGIRQGIEQALAVDSPSVVHAHIVGVLISPSSCPSPLAGTFSDLQKGLQQVCALLKTSMLMALDDPGTLGHLTTTLSSHLCQMDQSDIGGINERIKSTLHLLLMSDTVSVLSSVESDDVTARFVSKATQRLVHAENVLNVPLVLSAPLERQGASMFQEGLSEGGAKFLLQLLHAFEYLDAKPKSPFALDPRSVPLKRALEVSSLYIRGDFLHKRLYELTRSHCMDVTLQLERCILVSSGKKTSIFGSLSQREAVEVFYETMRSFVVDTQANPEADGSEGIFIQAKCALSEADLCSTVCNAFLASTHKPRPTFSYHLLCRDPLVLLKCPLKIWKVRSLRRIALAVMSSLLESNAILVHKASPMASSAEEFLATRNVVVVRCLLMCVCGIDSDVSPSDCAMTSGFIRSIISGHAGVVATIIKQGLSERAVDWLVEYVPECMNDSQELLQLLSDRSSLTSAERLVAADAVLRIAIVHGQNNDEEAAIMAYAALAQLIDSFFLVVGPVGVPVNALIIDDSGLDVTQISRKAAFRILKALMRVRGRRTGLRKECGMALQRLAGLCKSESAVTGVAGPVAGRRKTLLKEMFDLIIKAATTMGNVAWTQSTAA